ncbi:hypothetical protein NKH14_26760 [Mesorhizobium sp. M1380]|uniref:hypothetical protein n=1 Tax=Mesorhizobium sp. M1380 TaxID=2957093 RepID=UPI003339AC03
MPARPTAGTAFQRLISSEDNRQMLRNRLGLEVDEKLPASLAALLQELERREQVDWSATTLAAQVSMALAALARELSEEFELRKQESADEIP